MQVGMCVCVWYRRLNHDPSAPLSQRWLARRRVERGERVFLRIVGEPTPLGRVLGLRGTPHVNEASGELVLFVLVLGGSVEVALVSGKVMAGETPPSRCTGC